MNSLHQNGAQQSLPEADRTFAEALLLAKSGKEAKELVDGLLVQLATERPDLRLDIYSKVAYGARKVIGSLLSPEEAAQRVKERTALLPFTTALCRWIEQSAQGDMFAPTFRSKDLDRAGCARMHRDVHLGELAALGMIAVTSEKWHYRLTEKGAAVFELLKKSAAA